MTKISLKETNLARLRGRDVYLWIYNEISYSTFPQTGSQECNEQTAYMSNRKYKTCIALGEMFLWLIQLNVREQC